MGRGINMRATLRKREPPRLLALSPYRRMAASRRTMTAWLATPFSYKA
jgi:hypothetical protein